MIKCDFHIHVGKPMYDYDEELLIKTYARYGFKALAITNHNSTSSNKKAVALGKKYGVHVIPGMEKTLEGRHMLMLGDVDGLNRVSTCGECVDYKKDRGVFCIAPHPFYFYHSANLKVFSWRNIIDAMEFSYAYLPFFNPNWTAKIAATLLDKPLIANSDLHHLSQLDRNYTLIDAEPERDAIFTAIRKRKTKIVSRPLSVSTFFYYLHLMFIVGERERIAFKKERLLNRNLREKKKVARLRFKQSVQVGMKKI